jgi:hypothetical protein
MSHEVQLLRAEMVDDKPEETFSPNRNHRENQLSKKMQKEIKVRDDLIADLKCDNDSISAVNRKLKARIDDMEKQTRVMCNKVKYLDATIEELQCSLLLKDEQLHALEVEKQDLLEFISEMRGSCRDSSVSSDMLNYSGSDYHTIDDGENLAKSVVDVQLKEKDMEVSRLNEMLSVALVDKSKLELKVAEVMRSNDEKSMQTERLQKQLTKLANVKEKMVSIPINMNTHTHTFHIFSFGMVHSILFSFSACLKLSHIS